MTLPPRPRILLVDDDELLRRTFARILVAKFDVVEAGNGREALEILSTAEFDAVVTDLEMPLLGGDEIVGWLEANRPSLAQRVVVVTGGAKRVAQVEWLRTVDMARVLRKPCSAGELVAAVDGALRRGEP